MIRVGRMKCQYIEDQRIARVHFCKFYIFIAYVDLINHPIFTMVMLNQPSFMTTGDNLHTAIFTGGCINRRPNRDLVGIHV